ncbi:MAG: hypothetical protein JNK37_22305 [Verrucomicrobiales bacterium]|nr:hypothetical protein [Verrucomicrobiales bacterium]
MKSLHKSMLTCAGLALCGMSAAVAAPPVNGDLLLGVQATGGTGNATNVFVNLGPAHAFRDNPAQGIVANINDQLTLAFGPTWYTRTDVFFGVIANRSASSSGAVVNGDPVRTFYVSRAATAPGASAAHTGYTSSALGSAGTKFAGTVTAVAALTESPTNVFTMTSTANPVQWANSWTTWNPTPGASYTIFNGGIQNNFGKGGTFTYVDVQRIEAAVGTGNFVGAVGIGSNGDILLTSGATTIAPTITTGRGKGTGSVLGGGTVNAGEVVTFEAQPDAGSKFVGWKVNGAPAGTDPTIDVAVFEGTTVEAEFGLMAGVFSGNFGLTDEALSGLITSKLSNKGVLTGTVFFSGHKYSVPKGSTLALLSSGVALTSKTGPAATLTVSSAINDVIEGDVNGSPFSLELVTLGSKSSPNLYTGLHTVCFQNTSGQFGIGAIKVANTGIATLKGNYPNGTKFSSSSVLLSGGLPVYGLVKGGATHLSGTLVPEEVTSIKLWSGICNILSASPLEELVAEGSQYVAPAAGSPILATGTLSATFFQPAGGTPNLAFTSDTLTGTLGNAPTVSVPPTPYTVALAAGSGLPASATMAFNVKYGTFKATFIHPVTLKKVTGAGVVVQHQINATLDGVEPGMGCGIFLVKQKVASVTTAYPGWFSFDDVPAVLP